MPQLDAATYLSQIFWLGLTFGGYYLLTLLNVIPSLSRRRKVRAKKLGAGKGSADGAAREREAVRAAYDTTVSTGGKATADLLAQGSQRGDLWRRKEGKGRQVDVMARENAGYLQGLARIQAERETRKRSLVGLGSQGQASKEARKRLAKLGR